jgi:hypothetical protein
MRKKLSKKQLQLGRGNKSRTGRSDRKACVDAIYALGEVDRSIIEKTGARWSVVID